MTSSSATSIVKAAWDHLGAVAFLLLALALWSSALAAQTTDVGRNYQLDSGDVVAVAVFAEPDLSRELRINDNGQVTYPFLGEMQVAGLTVRGLENQIANGLRGDYLIDPKVTVSVSTYRPFFINGEVNSPGGLPFQPGLTVRKAISLAGGLTERASERKIYLLPDGVNDPEARRRVTLDTPIAPGDIITVEESFF